MKDQAFGHAYSKADLSALRRVFERFSLTYGATMSDKSREASAIRLLQWMAEGCRDEDQLFQKMIGEVRGTAEAA